MSGTDEKETGPGIQIRPVTMLGRPSNPKIVYVSRIQEIPQDPEGLARLATDSGKKYQAFKTAEEYCRSKCRTCSKNDIFLDPESLVREIQYLAPYVEEVTGGKLREINSRYARRDEILAEGGSDNANALFNFKTNTLLIDKGRQDSAVKSYSTLAHELVHAAVHLGRRDEAAAQLLGAEINARVAEKTRDPVREAAAYDALKHISGHAHTYAKSSGALDTDYLFESGIMHRDYGAIPYAILKEIAERPSRENTFELECTYGTRTMNPGEIGLRPSKMTYNLSTVSKLFRKATVR